MEVIIDPVLFCSFPTRQPCWYIVVGVSHKVVISTRFSITKLEIQHRIYKFCMADALSPVSRAVPYFNKTLLQSCLSLMPSRREGPSLLFSCVCLWPIDNPIIPESDQLQFSPFSIYTLWNILVTRIKELIIQYEFNDALIATSPPTSTRSQQREQVKNLNFDSSV